MSCHASPVTLSLLFRFPDFVAYSVMEHCYAPSKFRIHFALLQHVTHDRSLLLRGLEQPAADLGQKYGEQCRSESKEYIVVGRCGQGYADDEGGQGKT